VVQRRGGEGAIGVQTMGVGLRVRVRNGQTDQVTENGKLEVPVVSAKRLGRGPVVISRFKRGRKS